MMNLIEFKNEHHGEPPAWVKDEIGLRSVFENRHGEQWVSLITREGVKFTGGDIDWKTIEVSPDELMKVFNRLTIIRRGVVSIKGTIVNRGEALWMMTILLTWKDRWGMDYVMEEPSPNDRASAST